MNELLSGVLKQYLLKLKAGSPMSWAVLVTIVGVLTAIFTGTFDVSFLPTSWVLAIEKISKWAMPVLLIINEVIKQIKNEGLSSAIEQINSLKPAQRGLLLEEDDDGIFKLKQALKA